MAVAAAGDRGVRPGARVGLEQHVAGLAALAVGLEAAAGEQVADRRGHVAEGVLHRADPAGVHPALGLLDERLVVPAVGDEQVQFLGAGQSDQFAGVLGLGAHRLFAQHVQSVGEGEAGVFVVQRVRRGNDDGIQARMVDQLLGLLGGKAKAELLLNFL